MSRRTMLGLGGCAAAAGLGGCSLLGYGTWNFLWTVTVNTKDGPKSGSAVYQISLYPPWIVTGFGIKQAGVSPVIDLGERGWLIALASVDERYLPPFNKGQVPRGAFADRVDILTGLPFVRFTYLQGENGWHGGEAWPKDQVLAYASSALSSAKKVTAPADAQPVFAYAPRDAKALDDVKAYWAYELPEAVGPDVTYLESTLEPTWHGPSTEPEIDAEWYRNTDRTPWWKQKPPYKPGKLVPISEARRTRPVSLGNFGIFGL